MPTSANASNRQRKLLKVIDVPIPSDLSRADACELVTQLLEVPANRDRWHKYVQLTGDFDAHSDTPYAYDPAALESVVLPSQLTVFQEQKIWRQETGRALIAGESVAFFDTPPSAVEFDRRVFVFTGKCTYGNRQRCEQAVTLRGGLTAKSGFFFDDVDYLVVGERGSNQYPYEINGEWYGGKELLAVAARFLHQAPAIITEEYWLSCLSSRD